MATGSLAASTASTAINVRPNASGGGLRLSADLGTFLKLLTTQLQNQDPTKPMDSETLTQQLVQFATVEQQLAGNQTLTRLLDLQQAGQLSGAAQLVGRRVTVESDRLPLQGGSAEVALPAAGAAQRARITITDSAGRVVRREDVALGGGATSWRWDGRDLAGVRRGDGVFNVAVGGLAADNTAVPLGFGVVGRVTGATREDGALLLRMGAMTVGFEKMREVPNGS
jgi:flagellar basal-body rod modification protein FlgD